ncbi:MAG: cell wall hydrolase [Lachnospiraceae bacterium]|nr:cell wall hydrolase [Lachnospiraceae bacterium]
MGDYTSRRKGRKSDKMLQEFIESAKEEGMIAEINEDEIYELYYNYGEEGEYLVDGAILTCDRATTDVKVIRGVPFGYKSTKKREQRKRTRLAVSENAMVVNGVRMATVKDHIIKTNIKPFECNCQCDPTENEIEAIMEDSDECQKYGTCRKLMQLEDDWDNIIRDTRYKTFDYISEDKIINNVEGITMMSMLFCRHGGIITPCESGQQTRLYYLDEDIERDIANGLYTWEDFLYLVDVIAGEANTYEGMVAVAYEVLNRCRDKNQSIREIVSASGQYQGFQQTNLGIIPEDGLARGAAIAVLRGEVDNPIGDCKYHFGKHGSGNYDIWCDQSKVTSVIVIGEAPFKNVFFEPDGSVHNQKSEIDTEEYFVIYDHTTGEWRYDGEVVKDGVNIQDEEEK